MGTTDATSGGVQMLGKRAAGASISAKAMPILKTGLAAV